jgi:hypothetical protein
MNQGFVLVTGKDAGRDQVSAGRDLGQRIGCLAVPSQDMTQLEAIKLVLKSKNLLVVCYHLGVVIA